MQLLDVILFLLSSTWLSLFSDRTGLWQLPDPFCNHCVCLFWDRKNIRSFCSFFELNHDWFVPQIHLPVFASSFFLAFNNPILSNPSFAILKMSRLNPASTAFILSYNTNLITENEISKSWWMKKCFLMSKVVHNVSVLIVILCLYRSVWRWLCNVNLMSTVKFSLKKILICSIKWSYLKFQIIFTTSIMQQQSTL